MTRSIPAAWRSTHAPHGAGWLRWRSRPAAFWAARRRPCGLSRQASALVVPTAAGGGNDGMARVVAIKLSTLLGQQVIVKTRPEPMALLRPNT